MGRNTLGNDIIPGSDNEIHKVIQNFLTGTFNVELDTEEDGNERTL
jgi:hypothetical protein